jgi:hypothetical protein
MYIHCMLQQHSLFLRLPFCISPCLFPFVSTMSFPWSLFLCFPHVSHSLCLLPVMCLTLCLAPLSLFYSFSFPQYLPFFLFPYVSPPSLTISTDLFPFVSPPLFSSSISPLSKSPPLYVFPTPCLSYSVSSLLYLPYCLFPSVFLSTSLPMCLPLCLHYVPLCLPLLSPCFSCPMSFPLSPPLSPLFFFHAQCLPLSPPLVPSILCVLPCVNVPDVSQIQFSPSIYPLCLFPFVSSRLSLSLHFSSFLLLSPPSVTPSALTICISLCLSSISLLYFSSLSPSLSLLLSLMLTGSFPPSILLYTVCLSHRISPRLPIPLFSTISFVVSSLCQFLCLFPLSLPLPLPSVLLYLSSLFLHSVALHCLPSFLSSFIPTASWSFVFPFCLLSSVSFPLSLPLCTSSLSLSLLISSCLFLFISSLCLLYLSTLSILSVSFPLSILLCLSRCLYPRRSVYFPQSLHLSIPFSLLLVSTFVPPLSLPSNFALCLSSYVSLPVSPPSLTPIFLLLRLHSLSIFYYPPLFLPSVSPPQSPSLCLFHLGLFPPVYTPSLSLLSF